MTLITALMFYASCIGALVFSTASRGPDSSLLTVVSLLAIFNTGLLAQGVEDMMRALGRQASRWRDTDAPADWANLLVARNLSAEWYRRRYMSPMPDGLRHWLERGGLLVGLCTWLALVFRLGIYPFMLVPPTTVTRDGFNGLGVAILVTYGAWFIADAFWYLDRRRQDTETFGLLESISGGAAPRLTVVGHGPRKRDVGDALMGAVLELTSTPCLAGEQRTIGQVGLRYFLACPIYTGPTAQPTRMLRTVLSKFGWAWLIGLMALALGWFVPGPKTTGWAPHLFRMLAWTGTAAYAYFLYLATKSMAIRAQAEWPQGYSPCEFAPLRRLLEEAATLRDSGRLEYGRDFPETPVR